MSHFLLSSCRIFSFGQYHGRSLSSGKFYTSPFSWEHPETRTWSHLSGTQIFKAVHCRHVYRLLRQKSITQMRIFKQSSFPLHKRNVCPWYKVLGYTDKQQNMSHISFQHSRNNQLIFHCKCFWSFWYVCTWVYGFYRNAILHRMQAFSLDLRCPGWVNCTTWFVANNFFSSFKTLVCVSPLFFNFPIPTHLSKTPSVFNISFNIALCVNVFVIHTNNTVM